MGINGQTKSYLSAVIMLLAAALQADSFLAPMAVGGRTGLSQVSSARGVVKMELSPYEEYMQSRGQTVAAPESSPAPAPASSSPARAPRSSGSKWSPAKPDWKSSAKHSSPARSSYSPPAPAPAPASSPSATGEKHIGTGGMADTRDPAPVDHADPRKSISAAPSFEEYLKSKRN